MECISFWPSRERGRLSQMHPIFDEIKDSELNSKFKIIIQKVIRLSLMHLIVLYSPFTRAYLIFFLQKST